MDIFEIFKALTILSLALYASKMAAKLLKNNKAKKSSILAVTLHK